jgi:GxxExxY protein
MTPRDDVERRAYSVIGAFYEVYKYLGFGFLEQLYVTALEYELLQRGHTVGREVLVPIEYKRQRIGTQRLDLLVDGVFIVEAKATHDLPPTATRQVYNYLHGARLERGIVLHFGPEPRFHHVRCPPPQQDDARR